MNPRMVIIPLSITMLDNSVENGALDGEVVSVLKNEYDSIHEIRQQSEQSYMQNQQQLADIANTAVAVASE